MLLSMDAMHGCGNPGQAASWEAGEAARRARAWLCKPDPAVTVSGCWNVLMWGRGRGREGGREGDRRVAMTVGADRPDCSSIFVPLIP